MTVSATDEVRDRTHMSRAIRLARRGWGRTSPNPMVGCVVVKDDRIVGQGYHHAAGRPHAEVEALREAGTSARGAVLYCNLEPCSHQGRTPPCAGIVIKAGIKRVVAAMEDPNPDVSGRGFELMRRAGIEVNVGVMAERAAQLNQAFCHYIRTGRPFVVLKAAMTLDGKIAAESGQSKWISGEDSRRLVHRWRLGSDAVLVGLGTALADDPELSARPPRGGRAWDWKRLIRVVLDDRLKLEPSCRLLATLERGPVLIFTSPEAPTRMETKLTSAGAEVCRVSRAANGRGLDLQQVMAELGRREVIRVLLEGGAQVHASALEAGVAQRIALFVAPKLLGGRRSVPLLDGLPGVDLARAQRLSGLTCRRIGGDLLIEGDIDTQPEMWED